MGLLGMILGLALFLGVHALTTQRELRARLIASTGEGGYKIGYSLVSALGLVLIVLAGLFMVGSRTAPDWLFKVVGGILMILVVIPTCLA